MDEEANRDPVQIHILQGVGYIWNADDALYLRKTCGLIGAMVGGVAAFKQQNAVHGLPLQLYPEEVTLAVEEGWAVLCGPVAGDPTTTGNDNAHGSKNKKRKSAGRRYHYNVEEDEEEDFDNDGEDGYYYQHHGDDNDEDEAEKKKNTAPWQDALAKGTPFEIPTTAEEALLAQAGGGGGGGDKNTINTNTTNDSNSEKVIKRADVHWTFPSTKEQRDCYLTFKDLHSRGFRVTGGSKFGSDYLLYPGDPTLYHAQFCVRLVPFKDSILPALMASACRGSFQARKHLLYASVVMKNEEREKIVEDTWSSGGDVFKALRGIRGRYETQYMTFGPVDGFGKD
ncbi:hypothetical protein KSW81_002861 [Nannochloris sp. 'desiccata']|nr:hypothetical protein KSW81_002861 [Chlorella desiccata (nom. nud.)]